MWAMMEKLRMSLMGVDMEIASCGRDGLATA
jgi:hypothetical protein